MTKLFQITFSLLLTSNLISFIFNTFLCQRDHEYSIMQMQNFVYGIDFLNYLWEINHRNKARVNEEALPPAILEIGILES